MTELLRNFNRTGGGFVPQESITVYVVEDDESIRRAIGRLLRSVGYHALTFASAEEFLDSTAGAGEGCLILDIRLPGMTGLDLQDKLASTGAKYSIIFMTAHDNPQWQERAKKAGALAYLRKPFGDQSLLDAIRVGCGKRS
jgi:FixJ family two-component response regulator